MGRARGGLCIYRRRPRAPSRDQRPPPSSPLRSSGAGGGRRRQCSAPSAPSAPASRTVSPAWTAVTSGLEHAHFPRPGSGKSPGQGPGSPAQCSHSAPPSLVTSATFLHPRARTLGELRAGGGQGSSFHSLDTQHLRSTCSLPGAMRGETQIKWKGSSH